MAEPFRTRVERSWGSFAARDAELLALLAEGRGEELIAAVRACLAPAFEKVNFEIAGGDRPALILALEASMPMLFKLSYFAFRIPPAVAAHWDVEVGRRRMDVPRIDARWLGEVILSEETFFWAEKGRGPYIELAVYNERLMKHWQQHARGVRWMLGNMVDLAIGEAAAMRYVSRFDVLTEPREGGTTVDRLCDTMRGLGFDMDGDHLNTLINGLRGYRMRPVVGAAVPLRGDIKTGQTRLPGLPNGWITGDGATFDEFARDGVAAGFLCWPIDGLGDSAQRFRHELAAFLQREAGPDAFAYMGGAEGLTHGYLDLLAWDLDPVLQAAGAFFRQAGRQGRYVPFRRQTKKTQED